MSVSDADLSSLLSSSALILAGVVLASGAKLAERVVLGRAFGLPAYGEVTVGLAVLNVAVSVSLVGLHHGVPRYMSRFDADRDLRGVWLTGLVVAGGVGLVVAGALYGTVGPVARLLFEGADSRRLLRAFVLAVPAVVAFNVGLAAIRGMENTRFKLYAKDLLYPGLRLAVLGVLVPAGVGVVAAGYAYLAAAVVALVVAHLLFDRLVGLVGPVRLHVRPLVRFSTPLVFSMLLAVLLTRTDTLLLGYFRSSAEVGLYGAAYPLANSMLLVVSSFGYLYLPLTSRLDAAGEHGALTEVYRVTTKWSYVLTFPAFLALVAFPGDVLAVAFGGAFAGGGPALAVLSVGFFTSAAAGRNRETLSALGDTGFVLAADAIAFGANLALNLALVPAYGPAGAAVASASAFAARNAAINAVLQRRYGISPVSARTLRTYLVLPAVLVPPAVALSTAVSLSAAGLVAFLGATAACTVAVVSVAGCLGPRDAVALEFVEERLGVRVPFVRRYIPSR